MQIAFWKWEGAGNDFILVDGRCLPRELNPDEVTRLCDRHHGIGADGLIVLKPLALDDGAPPPEPALEWPRWEMDYCNADGTRSFCGNGSRASFAFLLRQGWASKRSQLLACDGLHEAEWDASRALPGVSLNPMQGVRHQGEGPAEVAVLPADHWFANSGSPHHVAFLKEGRSALQEVDVFEVGKAIRFHADHAPSGANVNFVADSATDVTELWARTYERGVEAETRACGTGATAIAVADYMRRGGPTFRRVHMPGGTLEITFDHDPEGFDGIWLHGPARESFQGEVEWPDRPDRPSPNTDVFAWLGLWLAMFLAFSIPAPIHGQGVLSDEVEVSLLTGSPGTELWSAWGHTAIRVYDPGVAPPIDEVYNYGTFAFGPGFYGRFLAGELNYRLSRDPFGSFQISYLRSGRGLLEQPLNLSPDDAQALATFLEWNLLPENRTYQYRFFKDNCATRFLTAMEAVFGDRWEVKCPETSQGSTYRSAVRPYLQNWPWAAAGVEWALGPESDSGPPCFACFLPDGLAEQVQRSTLDGQPIAGPVEDLVPREGNWYSQSPWRGIGPASCAWLLVLISAFGAWQRRRFPWVVWAGRLALLLLGLVGLILLSAWCFTDHQDLWANRNLIWCNPLMLMLWFPRFYRSLWGMWLRRGFIVFLIGFFTAQFFTSWQHPTWMLGFQLAALVALEPWDLKTRLRA